MGVGLRPGEIYGLHGHRVDWLRSQIQVIDVMTGLGLRQRPKSNKSHRVVPVPARTLERMSVLMAGRERDSLVFTAPEGGPVTDGHFRNRVWYPAIEVAGIRRFPPRIMRHTAAGWLVQDGVPLTTSRHCSDTRTTPRGSATLTWHRVLAARSGSPGLGVLLHQ
jgi:integrase